MRYEIVYVLYTDIHFKQISDHENIISVYVNNLCGHI